MKKREPKQYDDDDGRVIAEMNVEGMPWHDRSLRREKRAERRANKPKGESLTKSEARRFTWYAVLAGLTIVLVFSVVWVLFTLFLTQVLFR